MLSKNLVPRTYFLLMSSLTATQRKRLRLKKKKAQDKPTDPLSTLEPAVEEKKKSLEALRQKLHDRTGQQKTKRSKGWTKEKAQEQADKEWDSSMRKLFSNMSADTIDMFIENAQQQHGDQVAQKLRNFKNQRFGTLGTHSDSVPKTVS